MRLKRSGLLLLIVFFSSSPARATPDPRWLSLLHYKHALFGGYQSTVKSKDFFLAGDGRENPAAELEATLIALREPLRGDPARHAQCRFPARKILLTRLGLLDGRTLPAVDCAGFREFSYDGAVESISLIFATGYLSNPASFFGHPLLKFNLPRSRVKSHLLDVSINYGALTPTNENALIYVTKGLLGGYDASYSHRQFYSSHHMYGELELRDMWEYRLNLSQEETQLLVASVWELLGMRFPYYFFSDNCATAFGELVEDMSGSRLLPRYLPYTLPYSVFDRLAAAKRADGQPLVAEVTLLPSRQTRLTRRFESLNKAQRQAVAAVAESDRLRPEYRSLPSAERAPAAEALFDYYSFRSMADRDAEKVQPVKRELLQDRLELPATPSMPLNFPNLHPPHEGQKPFLTRLGAFSDPAEAQGLEFRFRTSYYDHLALDFGRPKNSSVRTADTIVDFSGKDVWLKKLDLIGIETLNLSQTGLPGDGGLAWKFETGFETANLGCHDCPIFKIEGGLGQAYAIFPRQIFLMMLDGRVQTRAEKSGHFGATPRVGLLLEPFAAGFWKAEVSVGYRYYVDEKDEGQTLLSWENRFGTSRSWDIRTQYERHVHERWTLSYSRFW